MSFNFSYTSVDSIPEVFSVTCTPEDSQAIILLEQNKSTLYKTYQVSPNDGDILFNTTAEMYSGSTNPNMVKLTVTGLTNKLTYDLKVKITNFDDVITDWIAVPQITITPPLSSPIILSVTRHRETQTCDIDIVFSDLRDEVIDPTSFQVLFQTEQGTTVTYVQSIANVDISGNIIV